MLALLVAAQISTVAVAQGAVANASSSDNTYTATVITMHPAPKARVVTINGEAYLNIGGGKLLLMGGGRCTYTTEYGGKSYADQDFTQGAGVGVPIKGAKPCDDRRPFSIVVPVSARCNPGYGVGVGAINMTSKACEGR